MIAAQEELEPCHAALFELDKEAPAVRFAFSKWTASESLRGQLDSMKHPHPDFSEVLLETFAAQSLSTACVYMLIPSYTPFESTACLQL